MKPSSSERRLFGTDGVRGVANVEPVTAETALKLGRAGDAATWFQTALKCDAKSREAAAGLADARAKLGAGK